MRTNAAERELARKLRGRAQALVTRSREVARESADHRIRAQQQVCGADVGWISSLPVGAPSLPALLRIVAPPAQ